MLTNGRMNLRVVTDNSNQVIVHGLSPERHPALKTIQRGDDIGMFNARPLTSRTEFTEGPLTILYEYDTSFFLRT